MILSRMHYLNMFILKTLADGAKQLSVNMSDCISICMSVSIYLSILSIYLSNLYSTPSR